MSHSIFTFFFLLLYLLCVYIMTGHSFYYVMVFSILKSTFFCIFWWCFIFGFAHSTHSRFSRVLNFCFFAIFCNLTLILSLVFSVFISKPWPTFQIASMLSLQDASLFVSQPVVTNLLPCIILTCCHCLTTSVTDILSHALFLYLTVSAIYHHHLLIRQSRSTSVFGCIVLYECIVFLILLSIFSSFCSVYSILPALYLTNKTAYNLRQVSGIQFTQLALVLF